MPTRDTLLEWLEEYGYDVVERGIRENVGLFLEKVTDKVIRTDEDAVYMIRYLNKCMESVRKESLKKPYEPAPEAYRPKLFIVEPDNDTIGEKIPL